MPDHPAQPIHPSQGQELLDQVGWVRTLALRLVRDPDLAEDLTQDTLLAALCSPVERPRSIRNWLASVVRNKSLTYGRSERRRSDREEARACTEELPSTAEVVERASGYQTVVDALLALEEPYRATLLYRFLDELSPSEIAEKLAVSESTVATRTAEGLRRLRVRLRLEHREHSASRFSAFSALWPSAWRRPESSSAALPLTGAIALGIQLKVAIGVVALACVVVVIQALDEPEIVLGNSPAKQVPAVELATPVAPTEESERSIVESTTLDPEPPVPDYHAGLEGMFEQHKVAIRDIRGRVIDLDGAPIPNVEVSFTIYGIPGPDGQGMYRREEQRSVQADAAGYFELKGGAPLSFTVETDELTTIYAGVLNWNEVSADPLVVVAPRIELAGLVIDESGSAIPGAIVSMRSNGRLPGLRDLVLDGSSLVNLQAETDATGAFAIEDAADLGEATIDVHAYGFASVAGAVPTGGSTTLQFVLPRVQPGAYAILGRVVFQDGFPAADTLVAAGSISVRSDAGGMFALEFERAANWMNRTEPLRLAAARPGLQPGILILPSIEEAERTGWPENIVLVLGGESLSIRGRVLDEQGQPLRGIKIGSEDSTIFGIEMEPGAGWGFRRTLEEISRSNLTIVTDTNGEFMFFGLLDRNYRIQMIESQTLLTAESEPIPAGSEGVELILDRSSRINLAGRIVDRDGVPLENVNVAISMKRPSNLEIGREDLTDAAGYFELVGVTPSPEFFRIQGEEVVSELFREIPADADLTELELVVSRLCRFQADWGEWLGEADELQLRGLDDQPSDLIDRNAGGYSILPGLVVGEGRSQIVSISDTVTHAVLLQAGEEVERVAVFPVAGETLVLRL